MIYTDDEPLLKSLVVIPRMADVTRAMSNEAITAYIRADSDVARRNATQGDQMDVLYEHVYRELLTYVLPALSTINRATHLL